jgi:hypothetical protein
MQADKRNMERMVEAIPDSDYQVLQNFLTHSSWDYRAVMDRVAADANSLLGGKVGTGLYNSAPYHQGKIGCRSVASASLAVGQAQPDRALLASDRQA